MKISLLCLAALLLSFSAGCSSDDPEILVPVLFTQSYIVESTGANATVTQVDYTDDAGATIVVMNPTLPWSVDVSIGSGSTARLVVAGTTGATSEITGRIQDDPTFITVPVTYATATCPENTNPCAIDISHTF